MKEEKEKMNYNNRIYRISAAAITAILEIMASFRPANAENQLVTHVLKAVSKVSDSIVTIILGLIVLVTVISLVRSSLAAQVNTQLKKVFGVSREVMLVLETITIFVLAVIALPVLKKLMSAVILKVGSQSVMLGENFHLPDY